MLKETRINPQVGGLGYHVNCYEEAPSTNSLAKDAIRAGKPEGEVFVATIQREGYGRTGHTWVSPEGGLYFSVLLRPQVSLAQLPTLSQLSSLAVREALGDLDASLQTKVRIKWPNDVMCDGSKLGGISLEATEGAVCVGIGINVFQPSDAQDRNVGGKYTPAYVSELCSRGLLSKVDENNGLSSAQELFMEKVLVNILTRFELLYRKWLVQGFAGIRDLYLSYLDLVGREVTVENIAGEFFAQGTVVNVNEDAQLVLRDSDGYYIPVAAGEVHLR